MCGVDLDVVDDAPSACCAGLHVELADRLGVNVDVEATDTGRDRSWDVDEGGLHVR
jgi:hypothetical protein